MYMILKFGQQSWRKAGARHTPVVIHDGVEPVRDSDDGGVCKLSPYRVLNEVVCLKVDCRRRLVQHQNLCLTQQSARQANQLTLTHAKSTNAVL